MHPLPKLTALVVHGGYEQKSDNKSGQENRDAARRFERFCTTPVALPDLLKHWRISEGGGGQFTVVSFKELLLVDVVYVVWVTFEILTIVNMKIKSWIATYIFQQLH
jgi:hypothetical protein